MISDIDFVQQSLALHLFFLRIMKEHSFFLQTAFTAKDASMISKADCFRKAFDALLYEAVSLSDGVVNDDVLQSGEVITEYTIEAERASAYYTGVNIPTQLTRSEAGLTGNGNTVSSALVRKVYALNDKVSGQVKSLIRFKENILSEVLSCKLFTLNYPLLIDHILREARLFLATIQKLQIRESVDLEREAFEQEAFWNRIMAEHAKFIRGLLDPTEEDLLIKANDFGNEFDKLYNQAIRANNMTLPLSELTAESLEATARIKEFKAQGTAGILDCKIRSIIIPLLADHTLREANHFLRLLRLFKRSV